MKKLYGDLVSKAKMVWKDENRMTSNKKILLLDDEPFNIMVILQMLKSANLKGFPDSVDCCYDAKEALKYI